MSGGSPRWHQGVTTGYACWRRAEALARDWSVLEQAGLIGSARSFLGKHADLASDGDDQIQSCACDGDRRSDVRPSLPGAGRGRLDCGFPCGTVAAR